MARGRQRAPIAVTAMALAVAVTLTFGAPASAASSRPGPRPELAAELLILRGDLRRLDEAGLSAKNREGLRQRIAGALGLLPWLLREAGDEAGAERLRAWQSRPVSGADARGALIAALDRRNSSPPDRSRCFPDKRANAGAPRRSARHPPDLLRRLPRRRRRRRARSRPAGARPVRYGASGNGRRVPGSHGQRRERRRQHPFCQPADRSADRRAVGALSLAAAALKAPAQSFLNITLAIQPIDRAMRTVQTP